MESEETRKHIESLIGSKVELVITSGLYKGSYPSTFQEYENGMVGVSHPMLKGAFLPALRSTELVMKIETSNCIYQAIMAITRSVINVTIPLLWLKFISTLEKVQRRMFVRVSTSVKAEIFFLGIDYDPPEGVDLPAKDWFSVRISDISLGGVGISIKENLLPYCIEGGRYLLLIKISNTTFFIVGKVVKILKKRDANTEIGLAYESLSVFAEKIMGSYIRQQELMTRG